MSLHSVGRMENKVDTYVYDEDWPGGILKLFKEFRPMA